MPLTQMYSNIKKNTLLSIKFRNALHFGLDFTFNETSASSSVSNASVFSSLSFWNKVEKLIIRCDYGLVRPAIDKNKELN